MADVFRDHSLEICLVQDNLNYFQVCVSTCKSTNMKFEVYVALFAMVAALCIIDTSALDAGKFATQFY